MDPVNHNRGCIVGATIAYNSALPPKTAVNAGREIEDTAQYIGKFFDSKEKLQLLDRERLNQYENLSLVRSSSVELKP